MKTFFLYICWLISQELELSPKLRRSGLAGLDSSWRNPENGPTKLVKHDQSSEPWKLVWLHGEPSKRWRSPFGARSSFLPSFRQSVSQCFRRSRIELAVSNGLSRRKERVEKAETAEGGRMRPSCSRSTGATVSASGGKVEEKEENKRPLESRNADWKVWGRFYERKEPNFVLKVK